MIQSIRIFTVLMAALFFAGCQAKAPLLRKELAADAKGLEKEEVRAVFRAHHSDLFRCYMEYVETRPPVTSGRIVLRLVLSSAGDVKSASIMKDRSTLLDGSFGKCVTDQASSWKFPTSANSENFEIMYPYAFKSETKTVPFPFSKTKETNGK